MRMRWALVVLFVLLSLSLVATACGGDGSEPSPADNGNPPGLPANSSGAVAPDTFMTFDGQRYQLRDVLTDPNIAAAEFSEIGAASAADVEHEGDLKVFSRQGEDSAVFTYSAPVEAADPEYSTPAIWYRWEPAP